MFSPSIFPNSWVPYGYSTPSYTALNQQNQGVPNIPKVTGFDGAKAYPMGANRMRRYSNNGNGNGNN